MPRMVQKQLNHNKSRQNDYFFHKFGMGMCFRVRKSVLVSEFHNSKISIPFVTSPPILPKNDRKNHLKHCKTSTSFLNLVWVLVCGKKSDGVVRL
jgi:hypothetical protein